MEQVLLVVQVILAIGLIGMVLIQRSDSDGFGLSGGSGNNLLSGRSAASAMTRITAIIATLFIINSLALSVIAARGHTSTIADAIEQQQSAAPAVPVDGDTMAEQKADAPLDATVKTDEKAAPAVPAADASAPAAEKLEPTLKPAKKSTPKAAKEEETSLPMRSGVRRH